MQCHLKDSENNMLNPISHFRRCLFDIINPRDDLQNEFIKFG